MSELQQECEMYERGIKKKRKVTKSEENPNGMLIMPEMGGKIVLSALQKGKGHMNHLRAEIEERGIQLDCLSDRNLDVVGTSSQLGPISNPRRFLDSPAQTTQDNVLDFL